MMRLINSLLPVLTVTLVAKFALAHINAVRVSAAWLDCALLATAYYAFDSALRWGIKNVFFAGVSALTRFLSRIASGQVVEQAAEQKPLAYWIVLVAFFVERIVSGIVFVVIANRMVPDVLYVNSLFPAALCGLVLAAGLWLTPLAQLAVVLALCLPIAIGTLLVLLAISGLFGLLGIKEPGKSATGGLKVLGSVLGAVVALPMVQAMVALTKLLPTNPASLPPDTVPYGLTAAQYYDLGTQYKTAGWISQAQESLKRAIELDGDGEHGQKARRFLATKLPKNYVPQAAIDGNIAGFNQMFSGNNQGAIQTFEDLIEQYPDFEWPYSNLAGLLITEKKFDRAKSLLDKALELNPSYTNAWLHLADLHEKQKESMAAKEAFNKAYELDPDDASVKLIAFKYKTPDSQANP